MDYDDFLADSQLTREEYERLLGHAQLVPLSSAASSVSMASERFSEATVDHRPRIGRASEVMGMQKRVMKLQRQVLALQEAETVIRHRRNCPSLRDDTCNF